MVYFDNDGENDQLIQNLLSDTKHTHIFRVFTVTFCLFDDTSAYFALIPVKNDIFKSPHSVADDDSLDSEQIGCAFLCD